MTIECRATPLGPAAHEELASTVAELQGDDPLSALSVVVPSNYVGIAARRALGRRGVAAVTFLTPYRLAELLGAASVAAGGRRPISTPVIAGAVRGVLRDEPGHFAGVETHPTTERSLVRSHRELTEVDAAGRRRLAATSARAADVVRIHELVDSRVRTKFYDERDLVDAAVDALADNSPVARALGPIIVFLPQHLTTTQARLLRATGTERPLIVLAGLTGDDEADAPVRRSVERLGVETAPAPQPPATASSALSVSDADDEVRHATRLIVDAARSGTPLWRCAVLYGTAEPYARLVGEALDAAGIDWFGASVRTTATSLLGRTLLDLLALPDRDLTRRDVSAWLASAPVRGADNRLAPTAAWERIARNAGVARGADQWTSRLDQHSRDLTEEAAHLARDEEQAWRARQLLSDAARTAELRAFIEQLAADLEPGPRAASWSGLASWCRFLVGRYVGREPMRAAWPEAEQRAARQVDAAIERLADLDGIDEHPTVGSFRRALELELDDDRRRHGRFGTGVLVGPVELALGVELDTVAVLGLAEGAFPARHHDDALLPDRERRVARTDLTLRSDRAADQHRALLGVLATADHATLTYPRGDLRRSAERAPSRWLLDCVEAHDGVRPPGSQLDTATGAWLREVPSFVAGLRDTSFPAHAQEYDVRALLDHHDLGLPLEAHGSVATRPELRRAIEAVVGRASAEFGRFDGNLAAGRTDVELRSPTDPASVVSATRLETWADCPHAYFVRYVLGVDAVDDPEERHRISPLVKGDIVHRSLDRWLAEMIDTARVPDAGRWWDDDAAARLVAIGSEECDHAESRGQVGRRLYWERDRRRLLEDLVTTVAFDNEQRALRRSTPAHTELAFGMPGADHAPVTIRLDDGRELRVRGSIDRVDLVDRGAAMVIVDYKTGKSSSYVDLDEIDPTPQGRHLQLVLYAEAARQLLDLPDAETFGQYWFVSSAGGFVTAGYPLTESVRRRALATVTRIIDGIDRGVFVARPEPPQWRRFVRCHFCEPDGLGTREAWSAWERNRTDPGLADYLELVEPELVLDLRAGDD